jgi:transcriptional regulator with XRE-family HTH domain
MSVREYSHRVAQGVGEAMSDRKVTRNALSRRTGMSRTTLGRRLRYESPFTVNELEAIGDELGVSVFSLLLAAEGAR